MTEHEHHSLKGVPYEVDPLAEPVEISELLSNNSVFNKYFGFLDLTREVLKTISYFSGIGGRR